MAGVVFRDANWTSITMSTAATGLSEAVEIGKNAIVGLILESTAWTTASLSFQVGLTSTGTFYNLYDDAGSEVLVTIGGGERAIAIDNYAGCIAPWDWVKLRSGTSTGGTAQADARTFKVVLKG